MEVSIYANMVDQATRSVADHLWPVFKKLSQQLCGQYGGTIEHLWISLELIESHARADGRQRFPFRFQKRVSGRSHFGLPPSPDQFHVGHFSVRPDFHLIATLAPDLAISYALSLIYDASSVLLDKQKKLGGFDAVLFRRTFHEACKNMGYELGPISRALQQGAAPNGGPAMHSGDSGASGGPPSVS